ncbi:hypothetical protein NMG60_11034888 [Bertholletia excelsa]
MVENQGCAYSEGVCNKIRKAIRRISHRPPSSKYPNSDTETAEATSLEIPIDFSAPVQESPGSAKVVLKSKVEPIATEQGHVQVIRVTTAEKPKTAPPVKAFTGGVDQGRGNYFQAKEEEGRKYNRRDSEFTNYIDDTKEKFTNTSTMGDGGVDSGGGGKSTTARLDSINDRVTNYINRAKMKLRTTSSLGTGRSISIK